MTNSDYEGFGDVQKDFSKDLFSFKSLQFNTKPITDGMDKFLSCFGTCSTAMENDISKDQEMQDKASFSTGGGGFMKKLLSQMKSGASGPESDIESQFSAQRSFLEKLTTINEKVKIS